MTGNAGPEFLTPDELVERWGKTVNRQTLANWRAQKRGPAYTKIGGRVAYRLADVEAWESENTKHSERGSDGHANG